MRILIPSALLVAALGMTVPVAHAASCDKPGVLRSFLKRIFEESEETKRARRKDQKNHEAVSRLLREFDSAQKTTDYEGLEFRGTHLHPGKHGGKRIYLMKREELAPTTGHTSYITDYSKLPPDYSKSAEYSGTTIENRFGETIANFFGFRSLGYTFSFIPDLDEIRGAFRELNRRSKPGTEYTTRFYEVDGQIPSLQYLRGVTHGRIPIAKSGHYRIHDLTAHFMWDLLPKSATELVRAQAGELLNFTEWLRARYPEAWDEVAYQAALNRATEQIDFGSFNWSDNVRNYPRHGGHKSVEGMSTFLSDGASPQEYIRTYGSSLFKAGDPARFRQLVDEYETLHDRRSDPRYTQGLEPAKAVLEAQERLNMTEELIRNPPRPASSTPTPPKH